MESTIVYATLLYLMSFRLLVIVLGGMSIYLGYRLFMEALGKRRKSADTDTEMEARFGDKQLTLRNAAPGTFFALFGVIIVTVLLAGSPPEFSIKTRALNLATEAGKVKVTPPPEPIRPLKEPPPAAAPVYNEITLRGDELPETAAAAHKLASKHFQRLLQLEEHAVALDNQNPDYQDSLAGLYFSRGDFELALQHQEKAVALAPGNEDFHKRLAAYRQAAR